MSRNCCSLPKPPCSDWAVAGTMIMKRMTVSSWCRCGAWCPPSPLRRTVRPVLDTTIAGAAALELWLQADGGGRLDPVAETNPVAGGPRHVLEDRHQPVVVDVAGHLVCDRLDLVGSVAHGDAPGRPVQHLEVVALVTDRDGVDGLHADPATDELER